MHINNINDVSCENNSRRADTRSSIGVHLKLSREIKHYIYTHCSFARIFYTLTFHTKDDLISCSEISRFLCILIFSLIDLIADIKWEERQMIHTHIHTHTPICTYTYLYAHCNLGLADDWLCNRLYNTVCCTNALQL